MNIRVAGLVNESIVDGPGFRFAIFTQGCPHACPGCHNPQTHDFAGGQDMDTEEIIARFRADPLLDGITLTGGDPFCQPAACAVLARAARERIERVWAYTGISMKKRWTIRRCALLEEVDVLIDGPFVLAERTLSLRFRGSKNQRAIDVPASLKSGTVVERTFEQNNAALCRYAGGGVSVFWGVNPPASASRARPPWPRSRRRRSRSVPAPASG